MLTVSLLGPPSFSLNGATLRSDFGPSGRLLAGYLFEFNGQPHRRERLADLFWPDLDADKARSAMNTAIWRVRKLLEFSARGGGKALITLGDHVLMERMDFYQVDTHALLAAWRQLKRPADTNVPLGARPDRETG